MLLEFTISFCVAVHKKTVVLLEHIHSIRHSLHHSAQIRTQFFTKWATLSDISMLRHSDSCFHGNV